MAEKIILKVVADTTKANKDIKKVGDGASDSAAQTTLIGAAMNKVRGAVIKLKAASKLLFGSIKAGIASTGIGLLLIAFGSLVSFFTKTKRGAEALKVILAGFKATFAVIIDRVSAFGEILFNAFSNPKQALSDLWQAIKTNLMNRVSGLIDTFGYLGDAIKAVFNLDWDGLKTAAAGAGESITQSVTGVDDFYNKAAESVSNFTEEIKKETKAAINMEKANQRLADSQRKLRVETAESRAEVESLKLIAEDVTKSEEERLAAAEKAFKIEQDLVDKRVKNAEEAVRLKKQENALGESTAEDLDALADLEVELATIRQESTTKQIELNNKINAIKQETINKTNEQKAKDKEAADEKAAQDADKLKTEQDNAAKLLELQQQNTLLLIQDAQEKALKELEIQRDKELASVENLENSEALKAEINKKYQILKRKQLDTTAKIERDNQMAALAGLQSTMSSMAGLYGEGTKQWKAMKTAEALIGTFLGAQRAYTSTAGIPIVGPILAPINAAIAVASGMAQVQKIKSTQIPKMAAGGIVGGYGSGTSDSVNARLSKGEAVINARSAKMFRGALSSMNVAGGGVSFAGEDEGIAGGQVIKTYVLSDEMTSAQDRTAKINRRSSI